MNGRVPALAGAATIALLAACSDGGPDDPRPLSEPPTGPTCTTASVDGAALELVVPEGFTEVTDDPMLRRYWSRPPDDGEGNPDLVAIDAVDPDSDATDGDVLLRTMSMVPAVPDSGRPPYERAAREVEAGARVATWTAGEPGRPEVGHTVRVSLEEVGGERFTVALVARGAAGFDELRDAVLPTVRAGGC